MTAADEKIQTLEKEVSELKIRVKELAAENRDLRDICTGTGVKYEELLDARRHKRYFADLCAKHPIGKTSNFSDLIGALTIVQGISACAGSVLCGL